MASATTSTPATKSFFGVVESLVATYGADVAPWLGGEFSLVTPYLVMMVVLLVRPYGLFGTREVIRI